jgi:hypothetical protein
VCTRGKWLIAWCEEHGLHVLNGALPGVAAQFTCTREQGQSVVDYMLCRDPSPQVTQDSEVLAKLSDHALQLLTLPIPTLRLPGRPTQGTQQVQTFFKWEEGTTVYDYADAGKQWAEHTDTDDFLTTLLTIVEDPALSNAARSAAVETFLLQRAVDLGVVKKCEIKTPRNPNKWGKQLAPWFTEACREAKKALIAARRAHGRDSTQYTQAAKVYRTECF